VTFTPFGREEGKPSASINNTVLRYSNFVGIFKRETHSVFIEEYMHR
jgi:hypothetical protein